MWFRRLLNLAEDINTLSFLVENSIGKDEHQLKVYDLRTKSKDLLLLIRNNKSAFAVLNNYLKNQESFSSDSYLAGSKVSAISKAEDVISTFVQRNITLSNYGYVSLGGGDGTEMYHVIEKFELMYGLLIDYDNASIRKASDRFLDFKVNNFKLVEDIYIDFIESDILDPKKLKIAKEYIEKRNLDGIIISIHALLHELSERSIFVRKLDKIENVLINLFKELFEWHQNIYIIIREPGIVENWKDNDILIELDEQHHEKFEKILEVMKNYYFNKDESQTYSYRKEQKQFFCGSQLAMEALTKLFYHEDFDREKHEQQTSISRELIQSCLSHSFKVISIDTFYTKSIKINMDKFGIKIKDLKNMLLPAPQCFSYIFAQKN